jgi:glutamate dehydrogenase (NAD(P)+)
MTDSFRFADDLGPQKLVYIWQPAVDLKAVVAIDNLACGPSIGGVRMAVDVSAEEAFRLARAMSLKNSAAALPHGGGKAVIFADPRCAIERKEEILRAFAQAIASLEDYIPGPDMGTNETCMGWIKDEIGRAVGLPREVGGIPLDEIGATGYGLAVSAAVAQEFCDLQLEGARVAIQGFGAVGIHAASFLAEAGAVLVAAADSSGTASDTSGLDVSALIAHKKAGGSLASYSEGTGLSPEAIIGVDCDIWIPAARPDVLHRGNAEQVKAKLVLQGANLPATPEAEEMLHALGVLCVPDFIANAGGVICAAVEYQGGSESQAFATIDEKIRANTRAVLQEAARESKQPRPAAVALAERRVRRAMSLSRWH